MGRPTHGEWLIGTQFNPSGRTEVDAVKQAAAALVDAIERVPDGSNHPGARQPLKQRAKEFALMASMWGVRAATLDE